MTTPFREATGSPVEVFGPNEVMATRRLITLWELRHSLVAELLGTSYMYGWVWGKHYPGNYWLLANDCLVEPYQPTHPDEDLYRDLVEHVRDHCFTDVVQHVNEYIGQLARITVHYIRLPT